MSYTSLTPGTPWASLDPPEWLAMSAGSCGAGDHDDEANEDPANPLSPLQAFSPIHETRSPVSPASAYSSVNENDIENPDRSDSSAAPAEPPDPQTQSKGLLAMAVAWFCMMLAILSGSAVGPAFKLMAERNVPALLAASWRCQCMCFVLWPLAILEVKFFGGKDTTVRSSMSWMWTWSASPGMDYPVVAYTLLAGLGWTGNLLCWVSGLMFTTTVRASIFTSVHPVLLIMYLGMWKKSRLSRFECLGTLVAFGGLLLAALDVTDGGSNREYEMEAFGDCLCFVGAVSEVVVIVTRSHTGKFVPLMQYTAFTTSIVALCGSLICGVFVGVPVDFSEFGLFGWLRLEWIGKMFIFAFVVGVLCVAGFNYAMRFISPLVFSSVLLIDPAVTGLLSWSIGIEGIPTMFTVLGGAIVMAGVGLIVIGEHSRRKEEQQESKLDAPSATLDCKVDDATAMTMTTASYMHLAVADEVLSFALKSGPRLRVTPFDPKATIDGSLDIELIEEPRSQ